MNRQLRFVIGAAIGLIIAGFALAVFATIYSQSPVATTILSGMTFLGIGLAVGGYLLDREGYTSSWFDFIFGFGVGVMLVSFFGTMSGTLTVPF
ncbi:MAG: hypothetical protein ACYC7D_01170 [Nitrososphaerales archaeon]